jgi:5-methylcytosine-specific restriction enzyme A
MPKAAKRLGKRQEKRIDRRKTAHHRGYSSRWAAYSRQYRRDNPACVKCDKPSECVDHIQPVTGEDDPLFWEVTNHQSLCNTCHGHKTATETNGRSIGRNDYRAV